MQLKEYAEKAKRTNAILADKLTANIHMLLGLQTEGGELSDIFKKNIAYGKPIDWINAQEEIGDMMWYISNFCTINGFDLEKILEQNIAKLEARYPEKFTEEKAENRDLTKEREILEELGYRDA